MNKFYLPVLLLACSTTLFAQKKAAKTLANTEKSITAFDLTKHLTIIAGAGMEGRETATEGERKAAAYISQQLRSLGIEPGNNGSYLQPFPLYRDSMMNASLKVNNEAAVMGKDFKMTTAAHTETIQTAEVVFLDVNDTTFKNKTLNFSGRVVMVDYKQATAKNRRYSAPQLISDLQRQGAAAALIINDDQLKQPAASTGGLRLDKYSSNIFMNYAYITEALAQKILDTVKLSSKDSLHGKTIAASIEWSYQEENAMVGSNNVVGIIRGTTKPDEYVVISAHYDHIGIYDGKINYGADDDGSGTVSVLEIAEAYAKAKAEGSGPQRSVVFLWVSGEEKGLLGSRYYSDHPLFPLDKTSMNLNIDMIGRTDTIYSKLKDSSNYIYVIGRDKLSSELPALAAEANKKLNMVLDEKYDSPNDPLRIYYRSDHYNFARKGVPVLFFFSGLHADYHRPTDTIDKIQFGLMEKRARMIYNLSWNIANRPAMVLRDKPLPRG